MKQIKFLFIIIIILIFSKFNDVYEKKHEGKSILEEKNVKKTIDDFSLIDAFTRFISDIFFIG
jgi:hypothetical protein